MSWFGESWGAVMCDEVDHVEVPVGKRCIHCDEAFIENDRGISNHLDQSYHLECFMRSMTGGAYHLLGTCTCCGGTDEPDPPGLSKREAARLALAIWRKFSVPRT